MSVLISERIEVTKLRIAIVRESGFRSDWFVVLCEICLSDFTCLFIFIFHEFIDSKLGTKKWF